MVDNMFYVKWYADGVLKIRKFKTYEKAYACWERLHFKGIGAFIQKPSY